MNSTYSTYFPSNGSEPIALTFLQAVDLRGNEAIKSGQLYWITDATQSGGTVADLGVIIMGMPNNKYSINGVGGFLNPDYQGVGDYSGTPVSFETNVGVWSASNEGSYVGTGIVAIWNGLHYQAVDGSAFDGTPPDINTTAYQALSKAASNVGYIKEWDDVEYDFKHNWIQSRKDSRGNEFKISWAFDSNLEPSASNFQWGNNKCAGNIITNATIENINNTGYFIGNIIDTEARVAATTNAANIYLNTFSRRAYITLNLPNTASLTQCSFSGQITHDLSANTIPYDSKELSPSISTFDAVIELEGDDATLVIPDYVGIITVNSHDPLYEIVNFSTSPSFKRRFIMGNLEQVVFNNTNTLRFPSPSTNVILYSQGEDFAEFLYVPSTNHFIQTASELY